MLRTYLSSMVVARLGLAVSVSGLMACGNTAAAPSSVSARGSTMEAAGRCGAGVQVNGVYLLVTGGLAGLQRDVRLSRSGRLTVRNGTLPPSVRQLRRPDRLRVFHELDAARVSSLKRSAYTNGVIDDFGITLRYKNRTICGKQTALPSKMRRVVTDLQKLAR